MQEWEIEKSITKVPGVRCSSASLGIKRDDQLDAALFVVPEAASYAGVFTTNQFRSACVESAEQRLHEGHRIKAVLITSGNANAGTGVVGRSDTEMLASAVAKNLGCLADQVVVLHTGVIGVPLRAERLLDRVPILTSTLVDSMAAGEQAARAIMTTDTYPKMAMRTFSMGENEEQAVIAGVAKGAGMIHPQLATMLSVIFTNCAVDPKSLQKVLEQAVRTSFNAISVDGDTSPNDSVILLASGHGTPLVGDALEAFAVQLTQVCEELAQMIVRDGEGATKFIEIHVDHAAGSQDAEKIAATVATSPLVKTAFFGEDFNPGRILSAIGRSGVPLNLNHLTVTIGDLTVFDQGQFIEVDEIDAIRVMAQTDIVIRIELGMGNETFRFFTCDLTYDYVRINAEYTT